MFTHEPDRSLPERGVCLLWHDAILSTRKDAAPNLRRFKVTYDELSTVASQLTTGKGQLEDQLTQLKGLVDNLIAEGFVTDTASGAFGASYTEFDTGTRQVLNGLDGLSQFLTRAADQFQQTDSSLASSLGS